MLQVAIPVGIFVCLLFGWLGEHMGEQRGKNETAKKMNCLLLKLSNLLEEREVKKTLGLIDGYMSGEASIHDVIPMLGAANWNES